MSENIEAGKKRVLVFASGEKDGGGSGFQVMVESSRTDPPILRAEIVGVVSNYEYGGVREKADKLGVPFRYWPGPFDAIGYQAFVAKFKADFVMASGWLKTIVGLDPARTVNIHPAWLPGIGGPGKYGHYVHEEAVRLYRCGEIAQSGVTIHFVTPEIDGGPIIFRMPVTIREDYDAKELGKAVNKIEHGWQSFILNQVVQGNIYLDENGVVQRINGAELLPH